MVLIEVPKKFLFWTVVCGVCATPSFLFAVDALGYDEPPDFAAMILGVVVFILAYTLATSSATYRRIRSQPGMRTTFLFGVGAPR